MAAFKALRSALTTAQSLSDISTSQAAVHCAASHLTGFSCPAGPVQRRGPPCTGAVLCCTDKGRRCAPAGSSLAGDHSCAGGVSGVHVLLLWGHLGF